MPWFKVDDKLHSHRKARKAGPAAMGLWVLAGSWSADQLSDGFVPDYVAAAMDRDYRRHAAALVAAGFWEEGEENGDQGWRFHDWADMQPTRGDVEEKRESARERMRRVRSKGGRGSGDVRANSEGTSGEVRSTPTRPDPTRPDQSPSDSRADSPSGRQQAPRKRGARLPDGWMPNEDTRTVMAARFPQLDLRTEHEKFTNYWQAAAGAKGTKVDWDATWRNWIITAAERAPTTGPKAVRDFDQERTDDYFERNARRLGIANPRPPVDAMREIAQ